MVSRFGKKILYGGIEGGVKMGEQGKTKSH